MASKGTQILNLTGLRFDANLGILEHEKIDPQPIQVDAELNLGTQPLMPHDDRIDEVVDYDFVRAVVHGRVAQGHINLQETLCDDILTRLLEHTGVMAARVSTRKPDVYPDCEAVGVEVFRAKPGVL